ncbi:MAG TPA: L-seryl-tRNA(Sec) selenium transferase [Patescibacteria group bacterium]|jgi:L-seryl-tRNA(Ser) seleniumtransferase|nr:L-seryl-tRNA(Sec) selenium transferase [Patescibacteria group bacterium]
MATNKTTEKDGAPDNNREKGRLLRQLPSIDSLLITPEAEKLETKYGKSLILEGLRNVIGQYRQAIHDGASEIPSNQDILHDCQEWLRIILAPSLIPMINASGVIVHTNLGRAPLSQAAASAMAEIAITYSNLEYDIQIGGRGSRTVHVENQIKRLTGAEAALVVNNNAAAVLLMLTALCSGREVIISRGQLIEIGGGFRIPDVMAQSGVKLVEVGTTNRTHLADYSRAITENTGALFVAHPSNYKIMGFTTEPLLSEIAQLAADHHLHSLYDQGSGAFLDTTRFGLEYEPTVPAGLLAGMNIVTFSADKLLGGPQAGILCGPSHLVEQLRQHPLARAVRVDKMALAALASTLEPYITGRVTEQNPIWQMISQSGSELEARAISWQESLLSVGVEAEVIGGFSMVGGGSLPGSQLATSLLAIGHQRVEELAAALRNYKTPVVARIVEGKLLFDPRTVLPKQDESLLQAIVTNVKMIS